ncbi:hypothetical protein [Dactylosporangium sp. NPDC005555]|uniref:hypothetical protein n=1 Tax=Dactylosporangium sp. NPDC005555 TaxID=3154889 RepID=UPI0033B72757
MANDNERDEMVEVPGTGFAREFRRQMSLSSGASEISSLSMFASSGATVRVGWPRLSPKKESAYTG